MNQKIRIKLRSYDHNLVDKSSEKIVRAVKTTGAVVSGPIPLPTVKEKYFADYPYTIKSLGAWGGDFILAVGDENTPQYFHDKGYETVLSYAELIK